MTKITEKNYSRDPYKTGSWQEKRIAAMNRASKAGGIPFDENNPWFNEWNQILHTKAKTLLEFKKENWYVRCRKQS